MDPMDLEEETKEDITITADRLLQGAKNELMRAEELADSDAEAALAAFDAILINDGKYNTLFFPHHSTRLPEDTNKDTNPLHFVSPPFPTQIYPTSKMATECVKVQCMGLLTFMQSTNERLNLLLY